MKINVEKLKVATTNAIAAQKDKQVEWDQAILVAEAEHKKKWQEGGLLQWKGFRDNLTQIIKKNGVVTKDMIPSVNESRYYSFEPLVYQPFQRDGANGHPSPHHKLGPRPALKIRPLESLKDFLDCVEEETVTVAALERVGYRNMATLMDLMNKTVWDV